METKAFNVSQELTEAKGKLMFNEATVEKIMQIPLDMLCPNPYQPRKVFDETALEELASSIKEKGVLQPIIVKENSDLNSPHKYIIIGGERRWRSAKKAGLDYIPAIVRNNINEHDTEEVALVENIQREQLSTYETMMAIASLKGKKASNESLASVIGKTTRTVEMYCSAYSKIAADAEIHKAFERHMKELTLNAAIKFTKTFPKLQKIFKDKREKDRFIRKIDKYGINNAIDKIAVKFSGKEDGEKTKNPATTPMFSETGTGISVSIKIPKNGKASDELLCEAESACHTMLNAIATIKEQNNGSDNN